MIIKNTFAMVTRLAHITKTAERLSRFIPRQNTPAGGAIQPGIMYRAAAGTLTMANRISEEKPVALAKLP